MRWRTKSRDGAATGDPPFPTPPDQTRKEGQSEEGESGMTAIPSQAGDGTARQQQGSGETVRQEEGTSMFSLVCFSLPRLPT